MTKIFFKTVHTGKHKDSTLVSIGLVSECGKTFYAELTNYNKKQVSDWAMDGIIDKLKLQDRVNEDEAVLYWSNKDMINFEAIGVNKWMIANNIIEWISQFDEVEFWGDDLSYSWVLFNDMFSEDNFIYHVPFDISVLFKQKELEVKTIRDIFALGISHIDTLHEKGNALYDARIIKLCYDKLTEVIKVIVPELTKASDIFDQMEVNSFIDFTDQRKGISFANSVRNNGNIKTKSLNKDGEKFLRVWKIK